MSEQIEREIAHLDTEPLQLTCEKCGKRAMWFAVWACCGADVVRCAEHATYLNAGFKEAREEGGSEHTRCGAQINRLSRLVWQQVQR